MKAVILAAGKGTRMRPLTLKKPKPLLEIKGKPLLYHIVNQFPEEIDELIFVTGYLGDQIKKYCKNNFLGKPVEYVEQKEQLGTYHALKLCRPLLGKEDRFFVFYADDIHGREGIEKCLEFPRALLVDESDNPEKFGVVKLKNKSGAILEIVEKPERPESNLVSTGVLLLDKKIFDYEVQLHKSGEYFIPDALQKMIKDCEIFAVKSSFWLTVGCPDDLKKATLHAAFL